MAGRVEPSGRSASGALRGSRILSRDECVEDAEENSAPAQFRAGQAAPRSKASDGNKLVLARVKA